MPVISCLSFGKCRASLSSVPMSSARLSIHADSRCLSKTRGSCLCKFLKHSLLNHTAVPSLITAHTLSSLPFRSNNFVVCTGFRNVFFNIVFLGLNLIWMRLHVYVQSYVHYSRRNAQLLYLSISQGSIGVLVFFHHIIGGVIVWGGGEGGGGGCLQSSAKNLHSSFSPILHFGFVCCPSRHSAAPPRRGKQQKEWYWDIKL